MNRPILACAVFAFASAALLGAQQSSPNTSPYAGTSAPPPDETIETSAPPQDQPQSPAKPHAGKPLNVQPAAPAPAAPQAQPDAAGQALPPPNVDNGMALPASDQPALSTRSSAPDPDGDIVHPDPLPLGVLGEGATIRVHLLERLSTVDAMKGDAFRSQVASDVLEGGQVLIPAGAEIDGHVVEASSGHLGGHGTMRLRPETVIFANGTRYRLNAYVTGTPGAHARTDREGTIGADSRIKRDSMEYGGAVGAGAITGAVLGGPVGALAGTLIGAGAVTTHLLVSHPQATLEPGTVLLFTLTQPLNLVQTSTPGN